jgi:hypothetical protein
MCKKTKPKKTKKDFHFTKREREHTHCYVKSRKRINYAKIISIYSCVQTNKKGKEATFIRDSSKIYMVHRKNKNTDRNYL